MTYDFFIIAIGSSAGGLPPLKEMFSALPAKTNAFVLVPHLLANYKSNLDTILSKHTCIPVVWPPINSGYNSESFTYFLKVK